MIGISAAIFLPVLPRVVPIFAELPAIFDQLASGGSGILAGKLQKLTEDSILLAERAAIAMADAGLDLTKAMQKLDLTREPAPALGRVPGVVLQVASVVAKIAAILPEISPDLALAPTHFSTVLLQIAPRFQRLPAEKHVDPASEAALFTPISIRLGAVEHRDQPGEPLDVHSIRPEIGAVATDLTLVAPHFPTIGMVLVFRLGRHWDRKGQKNGGAETGDTSEPQCAGFHMFDSSSLRCGARASAACLASLAADCP